MGREVGEDLGIIWGKRSMITTDFMKNSSKMNKLFNGRFQSFPETSFLRAFVNTILALAFCRFKYSFPMGIYL